MEEINRNIPEEAIEVANGSDSMRSLKRRERVVVWGLRGLGIIGILQVRDQASEDILSIALPFEDFRAYTIAVVSSIAIIASGTIRKHVGKQKEAMRINEINRQLSEEIEDYSPQEVPESHIAQYSGDVERIVSVTKRIAKHL